MTHNWYFFCAPKNLSGVEMYNVGAVARLSKCGINNNQPRGVLLLYVVE